MRKLVLGITLGTLVLLAGGLLHTGGVVRAQTAATPVPGSQRGTATKSCDASRVPVGSSVTCTITLGFATGDIAIFPDPVVIGVTGAVVTGASCSASATMPFPSNCMTTVTPTSVATNCTVGVSPACAAGTVAGFAFMTSITETLRCDVAGPVTETIVSGPDLLTPATLAPATPLTCTAQPAAVVLKTANPNPATFGQPLTYTVTVQNSGAVPTTALQLSDPLPAGVTFQSVTTTAGSCSQAGGTVSCSLGTLPAGGSATVTIRVTPLVTGTLTNTATVTSPGSPPVSGTVVTPVNPPGVGGPEPPVTGIPPLTIIGVPEVINPIFPVVVLPPRQTTPQQPAPQQTTPVQQPSFLINIYPPGNNGQPGSQQLSVGCNQVTISSPAGTAVSAIAARVSPPVVVSIYRFSNSLQRYQAGYFAMIGAPIDFSTTGGGFESYQICVSAPATISSG